MTDKRVVVPPAMLQAAHERSPYLGTVSLEDALEAALLYQREHLPLPSIADPLYQGPEWATGWNLGVDAVRRMYDAPAEPKGIDDLTFNADPATLLERTAQVINERIREAYARGLRERS